MSAKEEKIWADSESLECFFSKLGQGVNLDADQLTTIASAQAASDATGLARTLAGITGTLAAQYERTLRRNAALQKLERMLVRKDISGIGLEAVGEFQGSLTVIEPIFWIGATVNPEINEATNGPKSYTRIKIFDAATSFIAPANIEDELAVSPKRRGPKSYESEIRQVVEQHADERADWWTLPPDERHRAYRQAIKQQFGYDTLRVRGFGQSKLEGVETIVRALNN